MADFPDYQEPQANAAALSVTDLTATGLAKEAGGNLQTARSMLDGTAAGALVGVIGNTIGREIASWIAGGSVTALPGGTPLLHGVATLYSVTNQVIAPGGTFDLPNVTFAKPGVMYSITAQMSAIGSASPWVEAAITWHVGGSGGGTSYNETWFCPAGGASSIKTFGRGPSKGDTLVMSLTNTDTVNSATVTVYVWETTHHIARDDWRSGGAAGSSGTSAANGAVRSSLLMCDTFSVPGSGTKSFNLPLYAGQVNVWINQNVSAGSQVQIIPVGVATLASFEPVATLDWTAGPSTYAGIVLPRGPCAVTFINTAAGAVTASCTITALEYAS